MLPNTSKRVSTTELGTTEVTWSTTCEPRPSEDYKRTDGCRVAANCVSGEIARNSIQEYEGQFLCNSGTTFKCPAANW